MEVKGVGNLLMKNNIVNFQTEKRPGIVRKDSLLVIFSMLTYTLSVSIISIIPGIIPACTCTREVKKATDSWREGIGCRLWIWLSDRMYGIHGW